MCDGEQSVKIYVSKRRDGIEIMWPVDWSYSPANMEGAAGAVAGFVGSGKCLHSLEVEFDPPGLFAEVCETIAGEDFSEGYTVGQETWDEYQAEYVS